MPPAPPTPFERAAAGDVRYLGEQAPGVHVYAIIQPMGRVRAYQTAGLGPMASRGAPQERLLVGHAHTDIAGKVVAIEGFNGRQGEQFAEHARREFASAGLLTPDAIVTPVKPLKACPHTGFR